MIESKYRKEFRQLIHLILTEMQGKPDRDINRALRNAFPYGARKNWPYKMWLKEIRLQRTAFATRLVDSFGHGSLFEETEK